ncbi:MAG: APC family permease [Candidatus Saccharibacteria bacterium]|nr:APC family permease [Microbacteriaceae bacterium]
MHTTNAPSVGPTESGGANEPKKLRRNLNVWEAIGVSIALMAPAMAANINPQGGASVVGRAVPLSFVLATISALLIAYSFSRLSQRFNHAGSVYGFVGATMGPRSGIFAGWLLAAAYALFGVYTALAAGRFVTDEIRALGIWKSAPDWFSFVFALVALGIVWFFATRSAQGGTRLMLVVEGVTVLLILIVTVVILSKLLSGSAPAGQTFDLSVFTIPGGSDVSNVFLGVVFGFLSFAGFEGAATLGEETKNPRRDVPRAILGTVIFGGLFFIVVTAVEVMGFGTGTKGVASFVASSSLMGDLGTAYVGAWIGNIITIGAAVSATSCALACTVGASRLVFAMSRDGAGPKQLSVVSQKHQVPVRAVGVLVLFVAVFFLIGGLVFRALPFDVAVVGGTAGTLILLVAYFMANLGAIKLLFFSGQHTVSRWEIVIPILGLIVLGYTMFRNVYPFPVGAAWWGPGIFLGLAGLALLWVLARPAAARRAGVLLTNDEGLAAADGSEHVAQKVGVI